MFVLSRKLRYKTLCTLDQGSQGCVQQVLDRHTGQVCAIKVYAGLQHKKQKTAFSTEVDCLQSLREVPGVLHLFDTWRTYDQGFLVTELCNGSLDPEVYGKLPPQEVKEVAQFLWRTLKALHDRGFQHNDVKPANILRIVPDRVNPEPYRLCDFGLAFNVQKTSLVNELRGTIDYLAPECAGLKTTGPPILGKPDVWSWGVTLFELYTGRVPFFKDSINETLDEICLREPDLTLIKDHDLVDLLHKVFVKSPQDRPTLASLESHPYLTT